MAQSQVRYVLRKKETGGSNPIPSDVFLGEPLINIYDGILLFSGTPGGTYQPSPGQPGVFEVGSTISTLKVLSGINLNNLFIVTGTTGQITTYAGQSNLAGKFLSGTSNDGFVLADISSIAAAAAGSSGNIQYNNGSGGFGASSNFTFSSSTLFVPYLNVANSLSATTLYGDGSHLTGIATAFTGGTVNGATNFTAGLSAATIYSAGTNLYSIFALDFDVLDGGTF
jgi:hypothetical protein